MTSKIISHNPIFWLLHLIHNVMQENPYKIECRTHNKIVEMTLLLALKLGVNLNEALKEEYDDA